MLLFNTSSLYAAPPLEDHTTHTPLSLMPEPLSGSRDTLKLAATWWLPDWQGSQGARGSNDIGGGDIVKDDSDCMKHYNLYATCPSPKLSTGVVHPVAGMTCQKSCYCPSEYQYTSSNCSGKYTVSGGSCDGKYNDCVCKSEYSQNSSNCNGEYRPAGESCDGNYNRCEMRPECTVSSMSCTYGCAGYNSCDRCTSCKSNPDCDVSDKSCTYGCASYNSCSKCTSCKSNPDCSATAVSCDYGCALPQIPAANALPASPVRLRTLVPAFPAALTLTAPVALVTATPATRAMPARDVPQFQKILVRV